ncbi:ribokinase [Oceanobacillus massiliensis]|uniref:ribokinase n=1 Tax=Oceanobacillus massiliensis TaxID=1465765 RepID=UPI000288F691|nr:ribokinase [Oceanobacillus massiliensis]
MSEQKKVCVVGSINMDLTIKTGKMPEQGETVLGDSFATYPGGKGANQAVAAARAGALVNMIGAVGEDTFGKELLSHLKNEGIITDGVLLNAEKPTGIASIILSENDNRIIVAPGANSVVTPDWIDQHKQIIQQSDVVLMQLEIPMESVMHTIKIANEHSVPVVLNPAPFQSISSEIIDGVSYLTPNDLEASSLQKDTDRQQIIEKLIVTKGEMGVRFYHEGKACSLPGYKVEVVDTTGAGDTFNGILAAQLADGKNLQESVMFANAGAALSVTGVGAQGAMPRIDAIEKLISEKQTKN